MKSSLLIEAMQDGVPFERILHAIQSGKDTVESWPPDQFKFLHEMMNQVDQAQRELREAIDSVDSARVKQISEGLQEIYQMIEDSCEV